MIIFHVVLDIVCVYYKQVGSTLTQLPLGEFPMATGKYQVKVGFKLLQGKDANNFEFFNMSDYIVTLILE